jgi:hypothetical protein
MDDQGLAAWKLPLIVAAIAVAIVAAFYVGGPGMGMAEGSIVAGIIVEVRVVAPARNRFLDRWACEVGPGRDRAQRNLVLSLASLAGAGVDASARIGDEDLVQTVTDQLREYPATEVFLVTSADGGNAAAAVEDLRSRLHAPFHLLRGEPPGAVPAGARLSHSR